MIYPSRRSFIALVSSFALNVRSMLAGSPRGSAGLETDKTDTENAALHRAAYQSSSVDDDHCAHLVTDGSDQTYWESMPGADAWIAIDLGEMRSFKQVTLHWGQSFASAFQLQISNDGDHPTVWNDLIPVTRSIGGEQTISTPLALARHLRLVATSFSQPSRGCMLTQIRISSNRKPRPLSRPQPIPTVDGKLHLVNGNWKLQNSIFAQAAPDQIAHAQFDDSQWIQAMVPGTVLGSYLAIGAIPDPWYGDQMSQLSEGFFSRHDFWFRNTFTIPASFSHRRIWLNFEGINWKAEIFLNGIRVGRIDGAFLRGCFDVTDKVSPGTINCVAVLIRHVAHPEAGAQKITHKKLGMKTTNGDLLGYDSPTFLASAGWNWLPIVRGREIGIWRDVWIETSRDVTIIDPWVTAMLMPDHERADLIVHMEVRNLSAVRIKGRIAGSIGEVQFEQEVELAPFETRSMSLTKEEIQALSLERPKLWWPNGYGDQPLYKLDLRFECDGKVSDRKTVNFGIRNLESRIVNGILTVFVNGVRILCRGGNWGMAEGMLNCDSAGLDLRVRLHRDANLNMIRNWIGMEGHQAFYDACDRYGILIWDDFWLANPSDGPDPSDTAMFIANVKDKIRQVRSHPALALYCGRNEGAPPANLDAAMRAAVESLDGTRHYLPHSASGAVSGFGPYDVRDAEWYFANRGKDFHSEQGIVAIPTAESIRAMMPQEFLWPINDMWAVHDYQEPRSRLYTEKISQRYGDSSSLDEYCRKAQLMNLESAKAMYECLQANQGSGMLLWMTQAAWPSLICQLYDHYFEMTGAYFGAKAGCEPIHILWDANTDVIQAVNNRPASLERISAEAKSYDIFGREVWRQSVTIDLPKNSVRDCFPFPRPTDPSAVFFLQLTLKRATETLSDNFYWGCAKGASCTKLGDLPQVTLSIDATQTRKEAGRQITVNLANPSEVVVLAVRLKVQRAQSGERVLPVLYSDNYFSLLPGCKRTVSLEFSDCDLAGQMPKLIAEAWNSPSKEIPLA